jgi:predicted aspartyl protease
MIAALLFAAATATSIPHTAPLTVRGDRLFLAARINGVATEAVLDSAAEASFLDDQFAARIGAGAGKSVVARGSGGASAARLVGNVTIEVAGQRLGPLTVGVTDLDDVGARLFGHRLDAIVGRELFDAARLAIDIEQGTLAVVPHGSRPRGRRLALATFQGVETLPVSIEGHKPVWAEFDLGNGSDVTIGKAYAKRLGLLAPERVVAREAGGGIGGRVERPVVILRALRLAGVTFRNVRATIDAQSNAADANIGVKILRRFRIVTDFSARAVWLQPRTRAN